MKNDNLLLEKANFKSLRGLEKGGGKKALKGVYME